MKNAKVIIAVILAAVLATFVGCGAKDDKSVPDTVIEVSSTDADLEALYRLNSAIREYGESLGMTFNPQSSGELLPSSGGSAIYFFDGQFYYFADEAKSTKSYISFENVYDSYYKFATDKLDALRADGATEFGFNFDQGDPAAPENLFFIDINGYK